MGLHKVKGKGWRYDFQYQGERYTKAWFKTKQEAIAAREEHRKKVKAQQKKQTAITFSMIANDYLDYCQRQFKEKTYKYKASVYRCFIRHCGNIVLGEISVLFVENYLRTRPTNTNYNSHRRDLCALFAWAWKRKLIIENPCLYIDKVETTKKRKAIYSQEDIIKIFMAAGEYRTFLLALFSLAGRVGGNEPLALGGCQF